MWATTSMTGRGVVTPFKFPTLAVDMSVRTGVNSLSKHGISVLLVAMFTLQLLVPVVSATGMQSCIGSGTQTRTTTATT